MHLCVSAYLCLYLQFPATASVYVCVCYCWTLLWCCSRTYLFSGLGAPNSVAAKVRSTAVPVNDVWEERGADKDSYSSARRRGLTSDAHVHTRRHAHTHTHTGMRAPRHTKTDGSRFISSQTVRLPFNVYSPAETPIIRCHILLPSTDIHCWVKRQPSLKTRGKTPVAFCVSLTSELTT